MWNLSSMSGTMRWTFAKTPFVAADISGAESPDDIVLGDVGEEDWSLARLSVLLVFGFGRLVR